MTAKASPADMARADMVAEIMTGHPPMDASYYGALPLAELQAVVLRERQVRAELRTDHPMGSHWANPLFVVTRE